MKPSRMGSGKLLAQSHVTTGELKDDSNKVGTVQSSGGQASRADCPWLSSSLDWVSVSQPHPHLL